MTPHEAINYVAYLRNHGLTDEEIAVYLTHDTTALVGAITTLTDTVVSGIEAIKYGPATVESEEWTEAASKFNQDSLTAWLKRATA